MNKGFHNTVSTLGGPQLLANTYTFHHLNSPAQSAGCQASTCRVQAAVGKVAILVMVISFYPYKELLSRAQKFPNKSFFLHTPIHDAAESN